MAKKSLNMIEKMMDPNIIDYYIINCAIPSIITIIENRYQIDFGKPVWNRENKRKMKLRQTIADHCTYVLYGKKESEMRTGKIKAIIYKLSPSNCQSIFCL